jgi:hypothetical protein
VSPRSSPPGNIETGARDGDDVRSLTQYPLDKPSGSFEAPAPNRCTNPLAAFTRSVMSTPNATGIGLATAICFATAKPIARFLGPTGFNVMTRLRGRILAALSVAVMTAGRNKLLPAPAGPSARVEAQTLGLQSAQAQQGVGERRSDTGQLPQLAHR